jgi:hypothetical protein
MGCLNFDSALSASVVASQEVKFVINSTSASSYIFDADAVRGFMIASALLSILPEMITYCQLSLATTTLLVQSLSMYVLC